MAYIEQGWTEEGLARSPIVQTLIVYTICRACYHLFRETPILGLRYRLEQGWTGEGLARSPIVQTFSVYTISERATLLP